MTERPIHAPVELIHPLGERYQTYLRDESRLLGDAQSISFPRDESEIVAVVGEMRHAGTPVTVQGGRTGLAGAAVPVKGHVMNLARMNRIGQPRRRDDGEWVVRVEPGATLLDLRRALAGARVGRALFWPPDPTEATATVGGAVSCNARGVSALRYGSTREHLEAMRFVSREGIVREIVRGDEANGVSGCGLKLFDILSGGEGMYGAISNLTLRLSLKPNVMWGICFFFETLDSLCAFVDHLAQATPADCPGVAAMEYLDREAITIVERRKPDVSSISDLPDIDPAVLAAVYVELHGDEEGVVAGLAERLMEDLIRSGGDPDAAWAVAGEAECDRLRAFRHAAAESANLLVDRVRESCPSIVKLSTDMSLPFLSFGAALDFYESGLRREALSACVFGSVHENRLTVDLLPRSPEEHVRGRHLVEEWAGRAAELGGQVVNEHGVGKLKKGLLAASLGEPRWQGLRRCKAALDPSWFWNPGNMF